MLQPTRETAGNQNAYELARDQRIKKNMERMKSIGIDVAVKNVRSFTKQQKGNWKSSTSTSPNTLSKKRAKKREERSPSRKRTSRRQRGEKALGSSEIEGASANGILANDELWEVKYKDEVYTQEQVEALGDRKREWELFVEGYDSQGRRIYDKNGGVCCHQCRQKTLGVHTTCSKCNSLRGKFCGDCIYMRYGEHPLEIEANNEWVCPCCRDICNCSFCRTKKGWMPTGNMYRAAIASGYKSVAHYLVLSRQDDAEKAAACEAEADKIAEALEAAEAKRLLENPELVEQELLNRKKPHWLSKK